MSHGLHSENNTVSVLMIVCLLKVDKESEVKLSEGKEKVGVKVHYLVVGSQLFAIDFFYALNNIVYRSPAALQVIYYLYLLPFVGNSR